MIKYLFFVYHLKATQTNKTNKKNKKKPQSVPIPNTRQVILAHTRQILLALRKIRLPAVTNRRPPVILLHLPLLELKRSFSFLQVTALVVCRVTGTEKSLLLPESYVVVLVYHRHLLAAAPR
jgi:hypothetical protein